jgi:hypothetical protein
MVNKIQNGGDGYSVNVNRSIGGLPGFTRYSNNYKPVFDGDLLQTGGDCGCGDSTPMIENGLLQQNGGGDCGCGGDTSTQIGKEPSIFDVIQKSLSIKTNNQSGGKKSKSKNNTNITQFHAIREVSYLLGPLQINALITVIVKTFLKILSLGKPKKSKQIGGYIQELESILAPLGKNNLLVLASLLLLHHFAVEKPSINSMQKGGDSFLNSVSSILAPIGLDQFGTSVVLIVLQQAFSKSLQNKQNKDNKQKKQKNDKPQSGGNPLKELIAPLGTDAFIATGLLIILEKLFTNKVNTIKKIEKEPNKKLKGGNFSKYYEKLFNMVAPITFNAFATESTLNKIINVSKK